MAEPERSEPDSMAVFLTEVGKAPLLNQAQEVVLGRELRERHEELEAMLLASPVVWRQVLAWMDLIRSGELEASELMLRGRKTPQQVAGMSRRLDSAARLLRPALARAGPPSAELTDALTRLNLNKKKLLSLVDAAAAQDPKIADVRDRLSTARTALVEANIRLAVSVAKNFSTKKMEFADLVQEGTLGLMKAADRFDERLGFKFSTYATWWIRQSIQRALTDKAATIRLPAHVFALRERVRHLQRLTFDRTGREATAAELGARLRVRPKRLRAVLESAQEPLSFSAEPFDAEDAKLEDLLPDSASPSPLAAAKSTLRQDEVRFALGRISPREALVLRLRFGIDTGKELTLEECGKRLGLTRERVRQIEHKALQKLKAPRLSLRLKDYWGRGQ